VELKAQHSTTAAFSSIDNVEQPKRLSSLAGPKQKKKKLKTFSRYLEIESWKRGPSARDLEPVLRSVGEACKQINRIVQRAQTDDLYGVAVDEHGDPLEDTNIQGEVQQKLDVVCNAIMLKQFCGSSKGVIAAVASEEEDVPRSCPDVMVSDQRILFDSIQLNVIEFLRNIQSPNSNLNL
jgi:Fructose-1,6-bisphosphatase